MKIRFFIWHAANRESPQCLSPSLQSLEREGARGPYAGVSLFVKVAGLLEKVGG